MTLLWNAIKEAARAAKGQMSKNARNAAKAETKKERGPVKAFFHITKNENVPAIEQQGLLTNHPNANINSANHPFRKHGTDAGGVWVTTEPTAFPVYGTTIGGKNGNAAARADALSTIKIEVPLPELRKMKAVQDPYGKNILRKGDDPRAVEKFGTWAGIDVPTTVLLNDVKPQWLKNIGYVEEAVPSIKLPITDHLFDIKGSWALPTYNNIYRSLNKADIHALSGETGHRHGTGSYEKSPYRFVDDYIDRNRPIKYRLQEFPVAAHPNRLGRLQGAVIEDNATNASKRFGNQPLASDWTNKYRDYVKPGESINSQRSFEFAPGAISRGMGGQFMPSVKERNFDWNKYKQLVSKGATPLEATQSAAPKYVLDWDNIVHKPDGSYGPEHVPVINTSVGHISRGPNTIGDIEAVVNTDGIPYTIADIQNVMKDPSLSARERNKYRRDLIEDVNATIESFDNPHFLKSGATWKQILRAMMDVQLKAGQITK